jgi:hypothetical protein
LEKVRILLHSRLLSGGYGVHPFVFQISSETRWGQNRCSRSIVNDGPVVTDGRAAAMWFAVLSSEHHQQAGGAWGGIRRSKQSIARTCAGA